MDEPLFFPCGFWYTLYIDGTKYVNTADENLLRTVYHRTLQMKTGFLPAVPLSKARPHFATDCGRALRYLTGRDGRGLGEL